MHRLIHYYHQNKEKIWKVVLIIAFLLGMIYYISYSIGGEVGQVETSSKNEPTIYNNEQTQTYISDKSATSGASVSENEVERINNTITKFLQYCKNGDAEKSYNMISKDCKESEYNTLEEFKEKYLNVKFSKSNIFEVIKWRGNTYKVIISEDMLATGSLNTSSQVEYITIVEEESVERLNVNGYIGKEKLNKENTIDGVKVTAANRKVYMDYEEYELKIENLSSKAIKLDTLDKVGTMYLKSSTRSHYNAYSHELYEEDLEIKSKHEANITIKYAKSYSSDAYIEQIVFERTILDYPKYKISEDKENFEDICKLTIDL